MSHSSRPHGLQPTRLLCARGFQGKTTGVGCHCFLRSSARNALILNPRKKGSEAGGWAETSYSLHVPLRHPEERLQRRASDGKSLSKKQARLRTRKCFLLSSLPSAKVVGIQPGFLISQGLQCFLFDDVNGTYICGSYQKSISSPKFLVGFLMRF